MQSDVRVERADLPSGPCEKGPLDAGSAAVGPAAPGALSKAGSAVGEAGSAVGEAGSAVGEAGSAVGEGGSAVGEAGSAVGKAGSAVGRATSAVGKAILTVGRGLGVAYRMTAENRHYLDAVLCGFVGDRLAEAGDPLAIHMSFREGGRDVSVRELDLTSRLKGPGRTVVVTVHGLMCDEVMFGETRWQSTAPSRPGLGLRLETELGVTVLHVRYNSGLHISENGRAFSALLEELVVACGPRLDRLILLGHSMGGLVARSAGYYATQDGRCWVERLSTVVLLGVPTQGSFLEQFANLSAFVLNRVGNLYTALGGLIIEQRSHGIRDLRFGFMADEDWRDHPQDGRLRAPRTRIPPIDGVQYHVVVGTLGADEGSPLAQYFGDGLVGTKSAHGEALFRQADPLAAFGTYRVFPSTGHFELLVRPEVGDHVVSVVRQSLPE